MLRTLLFLLLPFLLARPVLAERLWIQVKSVAVRSSPEFYAPKVQSLSYGQPVQKIGEESGWVKVAVKGDRAGYVPLSAVSLREVTFSARAGSKGSDATDVVLAGKGFGQEVENQYRQSSSGARFDLVDRIEQQNVANAAGLGAFVQSGGLGS